MTNPQKPAFPRRVGRWAASIRRGAFARERGWRTALAATAMLACACQASRAQPAPDPLAEWLDQGWTPQQTQWWRNVSQGSRLIPQVWFEALEQPGSQKLFLDPDHVRSFGYEPGPPGAPPMGFVVDIQPAAQLGRTAMRWREGQGEAEPWIGMTCAACHSSAIEFAGKRMLVEGAPTGADFQMFFRAFDAALRETGTTPDKFARFAAKVLGAQDGEAARTRLGRALEGLIEWQGRVERQNETTLRYGPGRLDAVGHILNKVALSVGGAQTAFPADAPVRYPALWNAPQHDKVQWNGVAANSGSPVSIAGEPTDFGALGRNVGEVVGVFADISPDSFAWNGFRSSVRLRELIEIERLVGGLKSPAWPEALFGRLDETRVTRGREIYQREGCESCHALLKRDDLTTPIKANMTPLRAAGTDIWMACNAFLYSARAGALTGVRKNIYVGPPARAEEAGVSLLTTIVTGALIGKAGDIVVSILQDVFTAPQSIWGPRAQNLRFSPVQGFPDDARKSGMATFCTENERDLLAYKARPLNGVWAMAPYLHNGSVPTLYDLLQPARLAPLTANSGAPANASGAWRPETFHVGSRVFDPAKVGFRTDRDAPGAVFEFNVRVDGVEVLGNSNAGHTYGTALEEDERLALIEFLKSL